MKFASAKVTSSCPVRNLVTLKIRTGQGLYGIGDATLNGRDTEEACDEVARCIEPGHPGICTRTGDQTPYEPAGAFLPAKRLQDGTLWHG